VECWRSKWPVLTSGGDEALRMALALAQGFGAGAPFAGS
jgi:hypothetical protein